MCTSSPPPSDDREFSGGEHATVAAIQQKRDSRLVWDIALAYNGTTYSKRLWIMTLRPYLLALCFAWAACSPTPEEQPSDAGDDGGVVEDAGPSRDAASDVADATDAAAGPAEPVLIRNFDDYNLAGGDEDTPCIQWSFGNAKPLYVNTVTMSNDGYYHHSNWLVVPETAFPGEDGFFDCDDRGYSEVNAAVQGTVLFAQSTQAREEVQDLPDGVVVKIPPFHKVIAGAHLLNISPNEVTTGLRMKLDLVHPSDVETIVTGFRLSYYDLAIQPDGETRVTSECDLQQAFADFGEPFDMKLYWVLPHYHELGNYFRLDILGGPRDGETLFELEGFNAEANGQSFDPPIDFTGATGLRFSCGWNNPRDEEVGWGIGDQEMCVMLGLVDADALFDAAVTEGDTAAGTDAEGRSLREGPCQVTMIPKNAAQSMPTPEEVEAPLYVPDSDSVEQNNTTVIPDCEDTPDDASATLPATLTSIQDSVLIPGCSFSSCHDPINPAFGLDLKSDGLHERLMNHEVQHDTDLPLVDPGNAEGSWLYQMVSECNPTANGAEVAHMPRNSPDLMNPGFVAMIRDWIDAGAADD